MVSSPAHASRNTSKARCTSKPCSIGAMRWRIDGLSKTAAMRNYPPTLLPMAVDRCGAAVRIAPPMKILVVDDHPLYRSGVAYTLQTTGLGVEVVECASLAAAYDRLAQGLAAA